MLHHEIYLNNHSKKWLVMLHGLGGSSKIWYKQKSILVEKYNVLFIDLHGHGNSKVPIENFKNHTIQNIIDDIVEVMNEAKIEKAILMGVSLGSVMSRALALYYPERVESMILAGAVVKFNLRCSLLLQSGHIIKNRMSYMNLYKLFAWIMMPKKHHASSRRIFVREAKKLGQEEFLVWYNQARGVKQLYIDFEKSGLDIPSLYVMGNEDYMFLKEAKKEVASKVNSKLEIINHSGHLCNLEYPKEFNEIVVNYIGE